jgi:hypothetical protein
MREEPVTPSQLRVKAVTAVVTAGALLALLLNDWGEGNVFSPIRPALRGALNRAYGLPQPPQPPPPPARQPPAADSAA